MLSKFVSLNHFLLCTYLFPLLVVTHLSRFHCRLYWISAFSVWRENIPSCNFLTQTVLRLNSLVMSNLALIPQINNTWAVLVISINSSRNKRNHKKQFLSFLNWLLKFLPNILNSLTNILTKRLIVKSYKSCKPFQAKTLKHVYFL